MLVTHLCNNACVFLTFFAKWVATVFYFLFVFVVYYHLIIMNFTNNFLCFGGLNTPSAHQVCMTNQWFYGEYVVVSCFIYLLFVSFCITYFLFNKDIFIQIFVFYFCWVLKILKSTTLTQKLNIDLLIVKIILFCNKLYLKKVKMFIFIFVT